MLRVPFDELHQALTQALLRESFSPDRASECARLFCETTRDGVYTHGLARFPRFLQTIRNGSVRPAAEPTRVSGFGALERWSGNAGPGNLNARFAMRRAIELSGTHGIAAVALADTNHWMRGGTYGWQAAEAGCCGICWTNTLANLPPWGAKTPALGNNPLVLAVPRAGGDHVVLDMAMSQYSFGTLSKYESEGRSLPFPGGFDAAGELSADPAAIQASGRPLPIGLWKGSGLALMLDLLAATLSGGNATHQIPVDPLRETGLSQVFLALDIRHAGGAEIADAVIASIGAAIPLDPERPPRYPGEETLRVRKENEQLGVPVDEEIWRSLKQPTATSA